MWLKHVIFPQFTRNKSSLSSPKQRRFVQNTERSSRAPGDSVWLFIWRLQLVSAFYYWLKLKQVDWTAIWSPHLLYWNFLPHHTVFFACWSFPAMEELLTLRLHVFIIIDVHKGPKIQGDSLNVHLVWPETTRGLPCRDVTHWRSTFRCSPDTFQWLNHHVCHRFVAKPQRVFNIYNCLSPACLSGGLMTIVWVKHDPVFITRIVCFPQSDITKQNI